MSADCEVVICDDQEGFRRTVAIVLGLDDGVAVVGEAADGEEAIRLARELQPDVLLLDIAMPVMDGLEALPAIREASPDTRVVMLTGLASEAIRERALAAGATLFIEKGTDIATLAHAAREVCASG
ncbi:MAG TPA: response regulator transcription factor [Gaiellaceae bacterium]|nr:response regulator transcription factor [Gaiellaceae bacterium]